MNRYNRLFYNITLFLALCGLIAGSMGCAGQKKADEMLVESYSTRTVAQSDDVDALNDQLLAAAQQSEELSDYLLGAGDLVEVTVFEAGELNSKVRVSTTGYVTLPLLNEIRVIGLSTLEAEEKIESLYAEKYIRDPHVNVFVIERFSQRVTLVGEVNNPGTYDYISKQRLLDVLALGGGLGEKAGRMVQIRRFSGESGDKQIIVVDILRLLKEGHTELNIEINGGDVVFVPEAGIFFVDGAIKRPGNYPIKKHLTLKEGIMTAGGLQPWADQAHIVLIRLNEDDEREITELNFETDPEAGNIEIKDHDVIIARSSGWGKFVHGSRINLGFPGIASFTFGDPESQW